MPLSSSVKHDAPLTLPAPTVTFLDISVATDLATLDALADLVRAIPPDDPVRAGLAHAIVLKRQLLSRQTR
jgi:hypothetical protein